MMTMVCFNLELVKDAHRYNGLNLRGTIISAADEAAGPASDRHGMS